MEEVSEDLVQAVCCPWRCFVLAMRSQNCLLSRGVEATPVKQDDQENIVSGREIESSLQHTCFGSVLPQKSQRLTHNLAMAFGQIGSMSSY